MIGAHNPVLVGLSMFIAGLASLVGLAFVGWSRGVPPGRGRALWLVSGAVAIGAGIWSMHFVAMLAFHLPVPIAYHVPTLVGSAAVAMAAAALGLVLADWARGGWTAAVVGGTGVGAGIVGMHYLGMAAMRLPARVTYAPGLVLASIAIAIGVAIGGLHLKVRRRDAGTARLSLPLGAAATLAAAIVGMHYTAMAAARFEPAAPPVHGGELLLASRGLALAVAGTAVGILVAALVGAVLYHRRRARLAETEARRAGDERFRRFFEAISSGVLVQDGDRVIVHANRAACEMLGLPLERLLGRRLTELDLRIVAADGSPLPPADRPTEVALRTARPVRGILLGLDPGVGPVRWLLADAVPVAAPADPGGVGVITSFTDVTERVRAEQALRKANNEIRALVAASPLPVVGIAADGRVTSWNAAAERLFGWAAEEVLGRPLPVVPPEREAEYARLRARVLGGDAFTGHETIRRRRDGSLVDVSISTAPLRGPDDRVRGLVAVYEDITERKRAEAERQRLLASERAARAQAEASERRYRELAEAMPQIVWTAGADGAVDYFNRRWYDYTGLDPERSLGSGWEAVVHPDDRDGLRDAWRRALETGAPFEGESRFRRADGQYRWHLARATALPDDGGRAVRWIGTATDVHDQREAEARLRQAQRMEAIGQLAGGVAHDFNNILTALETHVALLLERFPDGTEERVELEGLRQLTRRAAGLTRQLLAFSRKQILQPTVVDLNVIVVSVSDMLRRLLGEHIDIVVAPDPALGAIHADPGQLEQVIVNLAVNARDAMPGGGTLTIETRNVDLGPGYAGEHLGVAPGQYAMLAVSDTGHGMDPETQARIFEPFFTTKELGKGTGLGLATVFGIVKQSGGHIFVYSEPGRGTTFKLYFPRTAARAVPAPKPQPAAAAAGGSETILLVEDDPALRVLTHRILARAGYTVLDAANPGEAILLSEQHPGPIHLLLTDVMMPRMSGRALADRLLSARSGMAVLYMSGYTDNAIVHHGVLDPGTAFLEKPFTPDALLRKVREVLDERAGRGSLRASV
ncbi:MAG TPA: PAS domain S-box protein [Gemmatimonadales bacterium]|nr:PAS domain S-box protein [Gemmatimonadales bacterium]